MEGTPRLRSAFPATPPRNPRDRRTAQLGRASPAVQRQPLPQVPTFKSTPTPASQPLIPEHIIDAPSQRLYAVAIWVALWTWRLYDFSGLQESEEQSLWLFMKWVALDGVFLFSLPSFRVPWLEWSTATMTLLFLAHAFADGMLMFRIPIPIAAALAAIWRGFWGAYETAVNEHSVNPNMVMFNDSLISGRQTIHILPEGSAYLNPERAAFCIDQTTRLEVKLPIVINATNPISMEILRVDLASHANETLHISKSQIKAMHKDASRLRSYSHDPNEPKTLYYTVKKPGLYVLHKVVDETNLEVSRKKLAHTVVVPCPKAVILPSPGDKCRGDLSNVELEVTGTPPMKVKYRKVIDSRHEDVTFENIQPDDFSSPLVKQDSSSLIVPNKVDIEWAKPRVVRVPLSQSLHVAGKWVWALDEIVDGFGNAVIYTSRDQEEQERHKTRSPHLHQAVTVHERPNVQLHGCTPQRPLKVGKGQLASLPLRYGSTGRGEIANTPYNLEYIFSSQDDVSESGEHGNQPIKKSITVENSKRFPSIKEPGLYTLTGVSTDFCQGDVLEPASCLLQNPPEPEVLFETEEIVDKCAGRPVGLLVNLDLTGTPPFEVHYQMYRNGKRYGASFPEKINGLRGQIAFQPREAGQYKYEFSAISDAVYPPRPLSKRLDQSVNPSASARFEKHDNQVVCIDHSATKEVMLQGQPPFNLEYELIHGGKRKKHSMQDITSTSITLDTGVLRDGGEYTLALVSVTDSSTCKESLKDEVKINVRHQKPRVSFGQIDARRTIDTKQGTKVQLPLRLAGEAPWTVKYTDHQGIVQTVEVSNPNDRITVEHAGMYELIDVSDSSCPGIVDELAKNFELKWIPRPMYRLAPQGLQEDKKNDGLYFKDDVCEGDEDAAEVLFKGLPPFRVSYVQSAKLDHGTVASKNKELRAALNVASLRMDTGQAGQYDYKMVQLLDENYDQHHKDHFKSLTIRQRVHPRPSAAFTNPGKTYSFCSVESEGEEVIPVTLQGVPPFELEVEIKHHGSIKPEIVHYNAIPTNTHSIRVPHSRLHLGKSAISLRRVSDSRGCARTLDSTLPRVQISVHDAPTITPLETHTDYCVGDRINFGLSGVAPFEITYTFQGVSRKARITSGNTFRRLAEKPGTFAITALSDAASTCTLSTNLTKQIHGLPSVRVSKGKDSYVDIHEGGQAEILFEFGGEPPFEFTYTRSANTDRNGRKAGAVLDMRSEISDEMSLRLLASEEGTYEVVSIKDRWCAYAKPGVKVGGGNGGMIGGGEEKGRRRLGY